MQILKIVFILFEVLVLFNILIFVHELGHFVAARWRGLKIDRFAIWFGKPIWKTTFNGVEYCLGSIPAGGYVALPQMAPMDAIEGGGQGDQPREKLPEISALDKIIVAFAGPLFSFLLAVVFALIVAFIGRPVTESETTTLIGEVEKDGPADKAGLKPGDEILEIDGKPITKWGGMGKSVVWRIISSESNHVAIKFRRDGQVLNREVPTVIQKTKPWQRTGLPQIRVDPAYTPVIGNVVSNSPAALAGLQRMDEVLEVNGQKLFHPTGFADYMEAHPEAKTLSLRTRRVDGARHSTNEFVALVTPQVPLTSTNGKPRVGIEWDMSGGLMTIARPGVEEQIRTSVEAMIGTFSALFSRKTKVKAQHMGGAVKILNVYYILFKSEHGWQQAIWFSVIMNVNLALLNLLPLPVLDGGHITLALVEAVRRKPVNLRLLQILQTSCAVLIIGFMLYLSFHDVQDLNWPFSKKPEQPIEMKFAPPPAPSPTTPVPQ
jgi:regulator of sigma E protease